MEWLNDILTGLDKIQGLNAVALVCFTCIIVGYILRFIKSFPNNGIPVVVILWGALMMLLLADPRATTMPARIWTVRNVAVGLIIGFVAWMLHKIILSRIETYISNKFPGTSDSAFFAKGVDGKVEQTTQPPERTTTETKQ